MRMIAMHGANVPAARLATVGFVATMLWAAVAFAGVEANTDATGVVLRGYDPVAYFTQGKPVVGDEQFSAEHAGGKYLFSTAANRDAFIANPAKYAPQYGGYCAFGVAEGAEVDDGPPPLPEMGGKLAPNLKPQ